MSQDDDFKVVYTFKTLCHLAGGDSWHTHSVRQHSKRLASVKINETCYKIAVDVMKSSIKHLGYNCRLLYP